MNYPKELQKDDKIEIVSLSSRMLGEDFYSNNLEIEKRRLAEYGLEAVFILNSLKGFKYLKNFIFY